MTLINTADKLYMGSTTAAAAYKGDVKVWPPAVANTLSASLRLLGAGEAPANASSPWVQVATAYSGTAPATYNYYSSTNGGSWVYRHQGTAGPHNFDTTYSSTIVMRVDSFDAAGNNLASVPTNTVTTGAAPVVYVQRTWIGNAVQSASYNGSGGNRNVAECYYGRFDSTHGQQKSLARWDIPAEIRNCVSVDAVEIHWWNLHHFLGSGGLVYMNVHYSGNLSGAYPGATALLRNPQIAGDPIVGWPAPRAGPINGDTPTDKYWLHWLHAADRPSVAEEIRLHGATGFGLAANTTAQSGYGYARGASQGPITLYITYTVRL